jgi:hypothetical protein
MGRSGDRGRHLPDHDFDEGTIIEIPPVSQDQVCLYVGNYANDWLCWQEGQQVAGLANMAAFLASDGGVFGSVA